MIIFQMLSFAMLALLLMVMLTQARPWVKAKTQGRVIKVARIGFWQRIRLHRSSLLAIATGMLFTRLAGWMPDNITFFIAGFTLIILILPMNYTFTTQGVAVGQAVFRPWSDFRAIIPLADQVVLEHKSYSGRLTLFIKPFELEGVFPRGKRV